MMSILYYGSILGAIYKFFDNKFVVCPARAPFYIVMKGEIISPSIFYDDVIPYHIFSGKIRRSA